MKKPSRTNRSKVPTPPTSYPRSAQDAFVTQKMLYSVRDELMAHTDGRFHELKTEIHGTKREINGVKSEIHEVKAEIHEIKSEVHEVKSEIHGVKAEIHEVKSEIHGVKAEIHEVRAEIHEVKAGLAKLDKSVHRVALLVEEQNNRNKIVLDGLAQLFTRQDRIEKKLDTSGYSSRD